MIDVILDEGHTVLRAESHQRRLQEVVAGQFIGDQIMQMQTFRRRVLDMAHVEVETSAVEEKSSVARWFLVIAVMQIDRTGIRLSKQIVFDLRRP